MGAAQKLATYEDLLAAPEHQVAELISGVLHTHPRPHARHAVASGSLYHGLHDPFHRGRGGPGDWVILLEPELHLGADVLVSDLAGWHRERLPSMPNTVGIDVTPDWVCEILSPGTMRTDRVLKMPLYARHGVRFLWLLDPTAQTLDAFALKDGAWQLLGSAVGDDPVCFQPFAAVTLQLAELWLW